MEYLRKKNTSVLRWLIIVMALGIGYFMGTISSAKAGLATSVGTNIAIINGVFSRLTLIDLRTNTVLDTYYESDMHVNGNIYSTELEHVTFDDGR